VKKRPRLALVTVALVCAVSSGAGSQGGAVTRCAETLARMADPVLMSPTTARRHGRRWCSDIAKHDRVFFKAIR